MKELTVEEKIAAIKNTAGYQDVKNAWFPPYHEKKYYFVSYSHKDYKLVYESLHRLQNGETQLNLWYDHSLVPGRDWEIEARRYIGDFKCKGVIFFLSENAVLSQSIHKEIEFVKNCGKSYLSINLPCETIEGHIGEYLSAAQMLKLLKRQGREIENYDEKMAVLRETFNDKITFLPFNEDIDSQIEKILSLWREPLLAFRSDVAVSVNDLQVEVVKANEFEYLNEDWESVVADELGDCAFANCRWLKEIELPEHIARMGNYVFCNCTSLENIVIPEKVHYIARGVFSGCTSLKSVTLSEKTTTIDAAAFENCSSLKSITMPNSVTSLREWAFRGCKRLEHITLSENIPTIAMDAFSFCRSLKDIVLPDRLTKIESGAFFRCESLETVSIPDGVTSIGGIVFYGCTRLKSITIPASVTSIGKKTFGLCNSLKDIFYRGTKQQWRALGTNLLWDVIAHDARENVIHDCTIHCADGDWKKDELTE